MALQEEEGCRQEGGDLLSLFGCQGYCQHYSIGYDEIFSSVAILMFIQVILAIAAYLDYEV